MRSHSCKSLALVLVTLFAGVAARSASGQEAPSRFVDEQTAAVVRFDLDRIDVNATARWLTDAMGAARGGAADGAAGVQRARQTADAALQELKKAGAKQVYVILSLADVPFRGPVPGFLVVPLAKGDGVDADAIASVLTTGRADAAKAGANAGANAGVDNAAWKAETIDDAVVAGPAATLERLRKLQPADRADLAKVLAGYGAAGAGAGGADAAAIVAALVPTNDMRRVVEETLPNLPAEVGGGPVTTLTRGGRWARLTVKIPPDGSLRLTVQSQDAAAARAMADLLIRAIKVVSGLPELRRLVGEDTTDRLVRAVQPKVEQDRVTLSLDGKGLDEIVPPLAAAATAARRQAAVMESANRMRQLLLGCIMYADAHQAHFPATLEEAAKTAAAGNNAMAATLLRNPRPAVRYQYLKPKASLTAMASVSDTLVLYEKAEKWEAPVVLGFADGHVIMVKDEAELRKHIEAAGKVD